MSYVGGDPNAIIGFDVIQLWDADHNVLWSWDSYDHIEELPIELMTEDFRLPYFERLHVNSIYEYDNGDLLLSSRQMSTIHRNDRQTGRVLWSLGGGPTNDFTFIRGPGIPAHWPLDFYNQHDARQLDDNVVFQIDLHNDPELWNWPPGSYRAHKHETFTPSEKPYVCAVVRSSDPDRLYCNWFDHEDEVFYYEIEGGLTPDTFEQWAIIQEGVWDLPLDEDEFTYYL